MPRLALATGAVLLVAAALTVSFSAFMPGLGGRAPTASPGDSPQSTQGPTPEPTLPAFMWPQTSLEELREAQALADAGDPRYTWQVDPDLRSGFGQPTDDTEIVARFLQEELGWEGSRLAVPAPDPDGGASYDNEYVRCAPGATNRLYPTDPRGGGCAPTMDDGRYERVSVDLGQLVRRDESGIWVVTGWQVIAPFEQVEPLSDAEMAALLGAFLQARVDGGGAQQYLDVPEADVPFLYASNTGARYVRSEFEVVDGPVWPNGAVQFKVRLFADDGEGAVEQLFQLDRPGMGFRYESEAAAPTGPVAGTTVNGRVVPVPYRLLDGLVTMEAAYPWHNNTSTPGPKSGVSRDDYEAGIEVVADPHPSGPDCTTGPAATDAESLAESIRTDPDFVATEPVAVRVAGLPSLQIDLTGVGVSDCHPVAVPLVMSNTYLAAGYRMRLYLLDVAQGSTRILAVAVVAPAPEFERALEAAAPVVDSIEIHAP